MDKILTVIYIVIAAVVGVLGIFSLLKKSNIAKLVGVTSLVWGVVVLLDNIIGAAWATLNIAGVSINLSHLIAIVGVGILMLVLNLKTAKIKTN